MNRRNSFNAKQLKFAKGEYQQLINCADKLKTMKDGRIIGRSEVFELQLAAIAVSLTEICDQCVNNEMESYLKQCLWRGLSFEDFMAVVATHGWRKTG